MGCKQEASCGLISCWSPDHYPAQQAHHTSHEWFSNKRHLVADRFDRSWCSRCPTLRREHPFWTSTHANGRSRPLQSSSKTWRTAALAIVELTSRQSCLRSPICAFSPQDFADPFPCSFISVVCNHLSHHLADRHHVCSSTHAPTHPPTHSAPSPVHPPTTSSTYPSAHPTHCRTVSTVGQGMYSCGRVPSLVCCLSCSCVLL